MLEIRKIETWLRANNLLSEPLPAELPGACKALQRRILLQKASELLEHMPVGLCDHELDEACSAVAALAAGHHDARKVHAWLEKLSQKPDLGSCRLALVLVESFPAEEKAGLQAAWTQHLLVAQLEDAIMSVRKDAVTVATVRSLVGQLESVPETTAAVHDIARRGRAWLEQASGQDMANALEKASRALSELEAKCRGTSDGSSWKTGLKSTSDWRSLAQAAQAAFAGTAEPLHKLLDELYLAFSKELAEVKKLQSNTHADLVPAALLEQATALVERSTQVLKDARITSVESFLFHTLLLERQDKKCKRIEKRLSDLSTCDIDRKQIQPLILEKAEKALKDFSSGCKMFAPAFDIWAAVNFFGQVSKAVTKGLLFKRACCFRSWVIRCLSLACCGAHGSSQILEIGFVNVASNA